MNPLSTIVDEAHRSEVVDDLTHFAEETVKAQSGITGMTLKTGLKAARAVDSGIVRRGVNLLLPEIADALNPQWEDYHAASDQAPDFGRYLAQDHQRSIDAILAVTDRYADKAGPLSSVYSALRGKATKLIEPTLPELGRILERHAA